MKDSIEIYVQPGRYGFHAGGRYPCQSYAAHKDDEWTAAYRCALRHWFPSRPNGITLYSEARAVLLEKIGEHEFRAVCELPDGKDTPAKLKRAITPLLITADTTQDFDARRHTKPTKSARKARKTKPSKRKVKK